MDRGLECRRLSGVRDTPRAVLLVGHRRRGGRATPTLAGRSLVVGVNDDAVKWRPGISSVSNDLGLDYYGVTQRWQPGQTQPSASGVASIDAALTNAGSQKILQSVFGSSGSAPHRPSSRAAYYSFVSSLLDRVPRGYESLQSTIPGPGAG